MDRNEEVCGARKLSEAEEMIMSVVWSTREAVNLEQIRERANARFEKEWRPQTVSTFLYRLRQKGFLDACRKGRHVYYAPKISVQEYRAKAVETILKRLYFGDIGALKVELEK